MKNVSSKLHTSSKSNMNCLTWYLEHNTEALSSQCSIKREAHPPASWTNGAGHRDSPKTDSLETQGRWGRRLRSCMAALGDLPVLVNCTDSSGTHARLRRPPKKYSTQVLNISTCSITTKSNRHHMHPSKIFLERSLRWNSTLCRWEDKCSFQPWAMPEAAASVFPVFCCFVSRNTTEVVSKANLAINHHHPPTQCAAPAGRWVIGQLPHPVREGH